MMVLCIWNKSSCFVGIPSYILAMKSSVLKTMTLLVAIYREI